LIGFVAAIAIAAYAIHGVIADDLVMLHRVAPWRLRHYGYLHLHGMWAIGGSICLLLGAAGFAVLSHGVIGTKPGADPRARFYRGLATPLILIGTLFFLGVSFFTEWFVR
jgi:hypothetical protein